MGTGYERTLARFMAGWSLLTVGLLFFGGRPTLAATTDAQAHVALWPESSRLQALAVIERFGQPERVDDGALTWYGLYRGLRTVVYRAEQGETAVEQVVLYRVPPEKVDDLARFDPRVGVDLNVAEMSARTGDVRTTFLVLNLAHEVASGFRTATSAREFYRAQQRFADAGKSSRYRERLLFADPIAPPLPRGAP